MALHKEDAEREQPFTLNKPVIMKLDEWDQCVD